MSFARDRGIRLVQMDTDCRVTERQGKTYGIQRINAYHSVERRIVSGTDDGLFSGDPVSLATHSDWGDMYFAA